MGRCTDRAFDDQLPIHVEGLDLDVDTYILASNKGRNAGEMADHLLLALWTMIESAMQDLGIKSCRNADRAVA